MKKVCSLCLPLFETATFRTPKLTDGQYLKDVKKYFIEEDNHLYDKILSLVPPPIGDIPKDHKPGIKLLEYNVGSLAKKHTDICNYGTSIIHLESSSDLQGGEIFLKCNKTQRYNYKKMEPGEHIFYPKGQFHGVKILTKGYRRVLVLIW